jgi:hypothetical protein
MPWKVFREKGKFCLHKMNGSEKGELIHCHDTAEMARRQQAALYVSENKEIQSEDAIIIDEDGLEYKDWDGVPAYASGAHSFEELEAERDTRERVQELSELMSDFQSLAGNIVYTPVELVETDRIEELDNLYSEFKTRATGLISEPLSEDKAKREDVSPADRKRAQAEYGDITYADETNKKYPIDSEKHIRAAWNYIRMPRNAAKYPDKGAAIKRRIIAAWKKKIGSEGPPAAKEYDGIIGALNNAIEKLKEFFNGESLGIETPPMPTPEMMIYKEEDGGYGWIASYSNKFMDRDNPPDIIASTAHKEFVEKVDRGEAPLPELHLWHVPEWKIGYATALAYDDSGFPIAIGRFDDNQESKEVAEWLSEQEDFGVSHGMWNKTIKRDPEDPTVIITYETHEISPLPQDKAANLLADWYVIENDIKELEEVTMTIPENKRQELLERGLPESTLLALEERNKKKAETASAEGIKSKEETTEAQPVPEVTEVETTSTEAVSETEKPVKTEDAQASEFPTRQEVADAIASVLAPKFEEFATSINELKEKWEEINKQITEVQVSDEKRIKELIQMTPRDSLSSLMAARLTDRASSSKQTKIGNNDRLLETKPREEKEEKAPHTGIHFIDAMIDEKK